MRVLFSISGGFGHLIPLLPLAEALRASGAEVAFACPEHFGDQARSIGVEVIPVAGARPPDGDYKKSQASRDPIERGRAAMTRYLDQAVRETPALRSVALDWGADVVVRETTALAAWLVGELTGLPTAVFDFAPTPRRLLSLSMGDLFARARAAVGLPPDPRLDSLARWLHLVPAPPGWYSPHVQGATTRYFQPPQDPPDILPAPALERPGGRPLVYVTLGTVYHDTPGVLEAVLEAVGGEEFDVLATLGPGRDARSLGPVPDNVRIASMVSQRAVLDRADAVLLQGGYAGLMAALRRGLPLVVLPLAAADQAANARRVAAKGNGLVVPEDGRGAPAIRTALRRVLAEPGFRTAAAGIAASLTELPPLEQAAELIRELGRRREPVAPRAGDR